MLPLPVSTGPEYVALDTAERGGVVSVPTSAPEDTAPRPGGRSAKQWLQAGIGLGAGALALTAGGLGIHALVKPHGGVLPSSAAGAQVPASSEFKAVPPAPVPPAPRFDACVAPDFAINTTSSAVLSAAVNVAAPKVQPPLYGASGAPQAEDLVNIVSGPTVVGAYGLPGVVRANVLLGLAKTSPDFIRGMFTQVSPTAYNVRLYDRNEADNTFSQVLVRVDVGEFDPAYTPVRNERPLWWALVLRAGQKLDAYLSFVPTTVLAGDSVDAAATRRQGIESVLGAHTEIVSGDELDALRIAEVPVIPPRDLFDGLSASGTSESMAALYRAAGTYFEAKNDNWPSLLTRMDDTRNLVLINLHQPMDFKLEALARNASLLSDAFFHQDTTVGVGSGAFVTVSSGGAHWASGDTFLPVTIDVPGQPRVSAYTGRYEAYTLVDSEPDAVWLQRGPALYVGYPSTAAPFKMPIDLLQMATAEISISRRPCTSDALFEQPGLATA